MGMLIISAKGNVQDCTDFVMTMLRKVSDFVYFLPFLFSLYHHPEHSEMFYGSPYFSALMHDSSPD